MLYVLRDGHGYYKIGFTRDQASLKLRIRSLSTSNSTELSLLGTLDGTHQDEKMLHRFFAKYRARGEWFKPEGKDMWFWRMMDLLCIDGLKVLDFDISELEHFSLLSNEYNQSKIGFIPDTSMFWKGRKGHRDANARP